MTNTPKRQTVQSQRNIKTLKTFQSHNDYGLTYDGQLMPISVDNLKFKGLAFQFLSTVVQSKRQTDWSWNATTNAFIVYLYFFYLYKIFIRIYFVLLSSYLI